MSRKHGAVCFTSLKLHLIKTIEQNISPCSSQKKEKSQRKWRLNENILLDKYSILYRILVIAIFLFLRIKDLLLILILSIFLSGEKFPSSYYIMKFSFKLYYLYIINTDNCIT